MLTDYYILTSKTKLWKPTKEECRSWRGNFCGIPLNLPYAPNGILFTPGYVIYNDETRKRIRDAYKELGHTHFPLNLTNHSTIYHDFYPGWDDHLINTYLKELLRDHIIPVGFVMGDQDTGVSTYADPDLVPIVSSKWEDPAPIRNLAHDQYNNFDKVRAAFPNSLQYWHNPAYQGAPYIGTKDEKNNLVWQFMVNECGIQGLMNQGTAWKNEANDSVNRLNDFIYRLEQGNNGYPKCDIVDFEETAYYMFDMSGNYNQALKWTDKIRRNIMAPIQGYCNG